MAEKINADRNPGGEPLIDTPDHGISYRLAISLLFATTEQLDKIYSEDQCGLDQICIFLYQAKKDLDNKSEAIEKALDRVLTYLENRDKADKKARDMFLKGQFGNIKEKRDCNPNDEIDEIDIDDETISGLKD